MYVHWCFDLIRISFYFIILLIIEYILLVQESGSEMKLEPKIN